MDLLQRAGWVKRALFLADRVSLVNQAVGAFKAHLPQSSPVNLVTEKATTGRVYACTYPTMMGLINETKGSEARFSVGHFDLVIIDEAHRSAYQKYRAIFRYFDSLLVGLTATPREQVDRNTYALFDLAPGVPTDAYELETAVADDFLVPPRVQQVDLTFPREGIDYDSLSDEEKEQWESLDWGDDVDETGLPATVNAAAINSWLFNTDTVDKALQHLMEHGHMVDGGDRLAKTIIFARNHEHATFIEERFNTTTRSTPDTSPASSITTPRIRRACSTTSRRRTKRRISPSPWTCSIRASTCPRWPTWSSFKPVYSRIKFWQMIGRGTRLCPDLFGPGDDKQDFRVFDFCFNFDFFREHPQGIEVSGGVSLRARLFRSRVQLLTHVQATPDLDPEAALAEALTTELHREVAAMNCENFIVRMQLEAVERFQQRESWERIAASDIEVLQREVAELPSEIETDDIESRLFDLTALKMQLALAEGDMGTLERQRRRVVEIARLLEEKNTIPAVKAQLAYLAAVQENAFWEGIALNGLEELRMRLRGLMPFLDKKTRTIVYTDFHDEITAVRESPAVYLPKMTGVQYEKKVQEYLKNHLDHNRDSSSPNQPAAHSHRPAGARADAGRDRRGRGPDAVDVPPGPQRRPLTGPFRAEPGGDGPRCRAGDLLGVPLQPKPDHAADPFHRDGDRPTHGAGCHGAHPRSTRRRSIACTPAVPRRCSPARETSSRGSSRNWRRFGPNCWRTLAEGGKAMRSDQRRVWAGWRPPSTRNNWPWKAVQSPPDSKADRYSRRGDVGLNTSDTKTIVLRARGDGLSSGAASD